MWIEIDGFDRTNLIRPETINISESAADPLASLSFELTDIGSKITLPYNTLVTVWDESMPSTIVKAPSRNQIINQLISGSSPTTPFGPWVKGGGLQSLLAFQITSGFGMTMTFANNAYTVGNDTGYIQQNVGNSFFTGIHPGQKYMASINAVGSGTILNIRAFITLQYLDGFKNPLGSSSTATLVPTTSRAIYFTSAVAPAGAVYAQVSIGGQALVSGTNSGTITFMPVIAGDRVGNTPSNACLEPLLFPGKYLSDGAPVTYPTPGCSTTAIDAAILPDGSTVRARVLFNGYVKYTKKTYQGTNRTYTVDCAPMGDVIDNGPLIQKSYEATTDQSILNDIVNTYYSNLLSTGSPTFYSPPTTVQLGQQISSVAYGDCQFRDVMNSLSDSTGFIAYVDQYNYVWYNDTPFNYSQYAINVENPDYVTSFPPQNYAVEEDGSQVRNSIKVLGGQFQTIVTDPFSGDGVNKTFTLVSQPLGMNNINIGGALYAPTSGNKIGVKGQDTLGTGGIQVLYSKNSSVVTFNTAPAAGANNVLITYPTYRNVSVLIEDNASVGLYKGRKWVSKVTDTSIADSATAQTRGVAEAGKYAYPLIILTFDLTNIYVSRGTAFYVTSALDGFSNLPFVVQNVSMKSLGGGVNVFSYTAGVYRPSMVDAMRNTSKALQSNTAGSGSTAILLTVETLEESLYSSDAITAASAAATTALYGVAYFGFSSFN